ncbi:type IV secretion system protein [Rodentibacter caecimuris]|uniref:type IV secretion system protein n=1 Tax=Rodentibacter caecimuris TaxID=1796644 RepID=UPI002119F791|nr:type IV secretion system protein [Rodentibacter heylii]MCQ9124684.1 type IV secretion system protein [Rodentibacter heylii]
MSSFIGSIYDELVTQFSEPVSTYATKIGTAAAPLFGAAFGAYIVFQAYKLYTNKDISIENIINVILVFGVIAFFIGANDQYSKVISFVQNAGDGLSASLSDTPSAKATSAIETIYDLYQKPLDKLEENYLAKKSSNMTAIGDLVDYLEQVPARASLWLSQTIFTVFIAINLLIAKVMVSLLLSVGIIFIMFAAYQPTRNLFTSWIGLALNYIFLNVMYSLAAGIAATVIQKKVMTTSDSVMDLIAGSGIILLATIIIVFAINQIPTLVSSLTGGVGISAFTITPSSFSGMGNLARRALFGKKSAEEAGKGHKGLVNGASDLGKKAWNTWKNRRAGSAGNK